MNLSTMGLLVLAFFISFVTIWALIDFSAKKNIGLDRPGRRKVHKKPIARIGGLGIFIGLLAAIPFLEMGNRVTSYFIGVVIILISGLWDDLTGIDWKKKMLAVFIATSVTIFYGGISVESLGNLFSLGDVSLGFWSIPFTYFCVMGMVSAINLIDGLNGLASGLSLIALVLFGFFSFVMGDMNFMFISIALCGATIAFIFYNFPKGRIFLGDSGSMLLGFSIAVLSINLFQGKSEYEPMIPVLIMAVPVYDTLRVMFFRILKSQSPFTADKTHLHHILLRIGLCNKRVVLTLWVLNFMFGMTVVLMRNLEGWVMLLFLLSSYIIISIFITVLIDMKRNSRAVKRDIVQKVSA